jgi:hypothetical protein
MREDYRKDPRSMSVPRLNDSDDLLGAFEAKEKNGFRTTVVVMVIVIVVGLSLLAYTTHRIRQAAIVASESERTATKAEEIAKASRSC